MDSDTALTLPQGVNHQKQQDYDIIAWSNRGIPKNKGNLFILTVALILIIAIIAYFSYKLFTDGLDNKTLLKQLGIIFFYPISWLLFLGVLAAFQTLTHLEVVKISNTHIFVMRDGRNAPKNKRFNKDVVLGLSFENYRSDGREFYPSLNILFSARKLEFSGQDREILATWMRTKEKYQLFLLLQHILKEREWDIDYRLKVIN
jgi:hypothetical protein